MNCNRDRKRCRPRLRVSVTARRVAGPVAGRCILKAGAKGIAAPADESCPAPFFERKATRYAGQFPVQICIPECSSGFLVQNEPPEQQRPHPISLSGRIYRRRWRAWTPSSSWLRSRSTTTGNASSIWRGSVRCSEWAADRTRASAGSAAESAGRATDMDVDRSRSLQPREHLA